MTAQRPLVVGSRGNPQQIQSGDTIDPEWLPESGSGSSVPLVLAEVFTIPANTQVLYSDEIVVESGGEIVMNGNLVAVN